MPCHVRLMLCVSFIVALQVSSQLVAAAQGGQGNGKGGNNNWGNAVFGALMNSLRGSGGGGGTTRQPTCAPYQLPEGFATFQDYCKSLSMANDQYWDEQYRNAPAPTAGTPFTLQGCVLGCIVGKNSYSRGLQFGSGTWSGKCIRNSQDVMNLLSPLPPMGGWVNVLDSFNWSSWLPAQQQFPGVLAQGPSWNDALYSVRGGRVNNAFIITYDDVEPPLIQPGNPLSNMTNAYAQLVRGTRDEMKLISPGFYLGQVWRRPQTFLNPLPLPVNSGIRFALFQVCDKRGNYASTAGARKLG